MSGTLRRLPARRHMAKKLNPQVIAAARKRGNRAERREQEKQRFHDEIAENRNSGGVIVIPPPESQTPAAEHKKLRVAAYCRVSTQEEEQVGSFEMQVLHFKQKIEGNPDWELVEIFKDEGISGTSINKRLGFQKMMTAAQNGEIDLIITKSISRFGRNIVDVEANLRLLAELNPPVTVEFEAEGLTSNGGGMTKLIITLLSALAEMESRQKGDAISAGIRWRMEEGIYRFSVHNTLGYYRDHFGRLVIEPTEAKIVEYIYESCLEGVSPADIARSLTEQGVETPTGKERWLPSTVKGILTNEKYCGDALMQKTYTIDSITHKQRKNQKLNKFFKENHHKAIISRPDWVKVQKILSTRQYASNQGTIQRMKSHVVAKRAKNGYLPDAFVLDPRWSTSERQEFLNILVAGKTQ